MREQYIRNSINTILTTWSILIQIDKNNTTSNEVILTNSIYELFSCICQLLQLDSNYILDKWEELGFNIDNTIDYIIDNNFEEVQ